MTSHQRASEATDLSPTTSAWLDTTPETSYDPLPGDREVDAAVVGGGITGLTAAVELAAAGEDVALLEADRIVTGITGKTTAKVTSLHGLVYDDLRSSRGRTAARQYATANERAIDVIADRVERHGIDCEFERTPAYTYATSRDRRDEIRAEAEAAESVGLPAAFVEDVPLPYDVDAAVRVDDQAHFHPREYLLGVAEAFEENGGRIYEETEVTDVDAGRRTRVVTDRGTVRADDVVVATHFPIVDRQLLFARQYPHRGYVLAVRTPDAPTEGMYYRAGSPTHSVRPHVAGQDDLVLVSGEGHKTGHGDAAERYRRLARWARAQFDVEEIPYRWSTQDYFTADDVPIVGRAGPSSDGVYVATGFGGWGMTNGTAAGALLADRILDRETAWGDVYDPMRFSVSAARKATRENAQVAGEYVRGWSKGMFSDSAATPEPGEATVTRRDGRPVGVYRDESGEVHEVSAVCTHMDCIVRWNGAEESWDCPCHGSRFDVDGSILDGPAVEDLPTRDGDG